ncbi:TauD/TfdA family dioxygenase [Actinocorallia longicatena]|uniref:TauD/TfdA family dioxygenase n=1 Tax=Actinocorallia longicatena TaxID=111803 RepID=A0ABP6QAB7_9ACTN
METKALSSSLGVEISGIDDLLDDVVIARCVEALKWRGVLLLRGADLDDETQITLSRKFGDVVTFGGREIFKVSLDPSVNPAAEYLKGTFNWHIDGTTDPVPIKATMLSARQVAMVGGGTEFASTYAAYENLPDKEKERIDNLTVVHSLEASQRALNPNPTDEQIAQWRSVPSQEVPLVWRRRDGRCSLVIGTTADHIVGLSADESRALLDELRDWSTQERFVYTHEWQVGDLVMWDNTGMLHRALPYDASSRRTMHRTTIFGDEAFK